MKLNEIFLKDLKNCIENFIAISLELKFQKMLNEIKILLQSSIFEKFR